MAFGLCIAAVVLAGVRLAQSKGTDLLGWGLACVGVSLLWGRF